MPNFRYKAMTPSGEVVTGMLDASSKSEVIQQLQNLGQFPISADDASAGGSRSWLSADLWPVRRASLRDLSIATQELSALLHAGLPLDRSVELLIGLGETRRLRGPFANALARLRDGASLTEAIGGEETFSRFYVSMVHAGEVGGNLEGTLRRLSEYLARAYMTREAVISALIYPAIVLVAACLSIMVILLFVLPEFEPLFESAGASLPLATRIVIGIGGVVKEGWWIFIVVGIVTASALRAGLRRPVFRYKWDAAALRAPLFGNLISKIEMERFSRTLGSLLSSGVTLPAALAITKDTVGNSVIARAIGDTGASLREGEELSSRLAQTKVFPTIALDLIRVGEETGKLDEMLLRQADICERSVRQTVDRLLALLVPAITIFLGCMVAGLVASMLVAILSVNALALR